MPKSEHEQISHGARASVGSERLTHLVYEASLDNSLWPEIILELTDQINNVGVDNDPTADLGETAQHFKRAMHISEKIVTLQEKEQQLTSVIDSLAVGISVLDESGALLIENSAASEANRQLTLSDGPTTLPLTSVETGKQRALAQWVREANSSAEPVNLVVAGTHKTPNINALLLPREIATEIGFPPSAAGVLLTFDPGDSDGLRAFAADCLLTPRETDLLESLQRSQDLRTAAEEIRLSYESARTYLKRIFSKTGCTSQSELFQRIASSPASFLKRRAAATAEGQKVRRLCTLRDGRTLEYFLIGPEDGYPVLYFDALSGSSIDAVGAPDRYTPTLKRLNMRLITICRPGGFRSTMHQVNSLRDYSPDVEELCAHLNIDRFSMLSYSFGSGAALAVAHELQARVDRLILSSAAYPAYKHPNWRELDLFYQLSMVIGRRWPNMLRQILPFLIRSILQNVNRYFERHMSRSRCASDIEILSSPVTLQRTKQMLSERVAITMEGMIEENLLNAQGWDFDVKDIYVPVTLLHGVEDNVSPLAAAQLLQQHLPNAVLHELKDFGHYHIFTQWSWILTAAAGKPFETP